MVLTDSRKKRRAEKALLPRWASLFPFLCVRWTETPAPSMHWPKFPRSLRPRSSTAGIGTSNQEEEAEGFLHKRFDTFTTNFMKRQRWANVTQKPWWKPNNGSIISSFQKFERALKFKFQSLKGFQNLIIYVSYTKVHPLKTQIWNLK